MVRNTGRVLGVAVVGALFSSMLARWTSVSPQTVFFEALHKARFAVAGIAVLGMLISLAREAATNCGRFSCSRSRDFQPIVPAR